MTNPIETLEMFHPLEQNEAFALAQLCKRIGYQECRANAINQDEAQLMISALFKIQHALADIGIAPR
jgi:hypothetical protein